MMSAVGIWSMHRLGTSSIIMADGEEDLKLKYSGGYSGGVLVLPVVLVGGSFYVFSISEKVGILRTLIGGLLVGGGICGMHYLDEHGISNYTTVYRPGYIVGAALIAVTASTIALGLFFYLNSKWTNNWLKRLSCAIILALAVSGMFWVAKMGTSYRYKKVAKVDSHSVRRRISAIIVFSLVKSSTSLPHVRNC